MNEKNNCPPEKSERAGERGLKRTVILLSIVDLIQSAAILGLVVKTRKIIAVLVNFSGILDQFTQLLDNIYAEFDVLSQLVDMIVSFQSNIYKLVQ